MKNKKILSLIILMTIVLNMMFATEYKGKTTVENECVDKGCQQLIEVDLGEYKGTTGDFVIGYDRYASSKWDKCTNDYFYKQMNEEQKSLYDGLYSVCMTYLTTTSDAEEYNVYTGFSEKVFAPEGLEEDKVLDVLYAFIYSNPQFYFINEYYGLGEYRSQYYVTVGIYNEWIDGDVRIETTNELSDKIDEWMQVVNQETSLLDKEKKIHDLIVLNTTYEYADYDQSCVSVLLEGKSVCAGYAETFNLLCNRAGIITISVSSSNHMWNKVQMYGEWYNVDCTWDDPIGATGIRYDYFNVSDRSIDDSDHVLDCMWNNFLIPRCEHDEVIEHTSYWNGNKYIKDGMLQSNVFFAPIRENPSVNWFYFAYSTDDINAGTEAYEIRTGWLRDEQTGKLHFAFPENGLLMADMWSSDKKYYFDGLDLAIGKFVADDGYTYFSYSENATINGQKVTGIVQSGWVMDEQTGDLYYCFPENNRMAIGIQLGNYIFDENGKCLNP